MDCSNLSDVESLGAVWKFPAIVVCLCSLCLLSASLGLKHRTVTPSATVPGVPADFSPPESVSPLLFVLAAICRFLSGSLLPYPSHLLYCAHRLSFFHFFIFHFWKSRGFSLRLPYLCREFLIFVCLRCLAIASWSLFVLGSLRYLSDNSDLFGLGVGTHRLPFLLRDELHGVLDGMSG